MVTQVENLTALSNGASWGTANNTIISNCVKGLPTSPIYNYEITPLAADPDALLPLNSYVAGALPIQDNGPGVTAVTSGKYDGTFMLDVERGLVIVCGGSPSGAANLTFNGYDQYGRKLTKVVSINLNAGGKVFVPTGFKYLVSVISSANVTAISIGTADIFTVPFHIINQADAIVSWTGQNPYRNSFVVTLAAGTATVLNDNFFFPAGTAPGTPASLTNFQVLSILNNSSAGTLSFTGSTNTLTIQSSSGSDASTYLIGYQGIDSFKPFLQLGTLAPQTSGSNSITDVKGTVSLVDYNYQNANPNNTADVYLTGSANGTRTLSVRQYLAQCVDAPGVPNDQSTLTYFGATPYSNF